MVGRSLSVIGNEDGAFGREGAHKTVDCGRPQEMAESVTHRSQSTQQPFSFLPPSRSPPQHHHLLKYSHFGYCISIFFLEGCMIKKLALLEPNSSVARMRNYVDIFQRSEVSLEADSERLGARLR